MHILISLTIKRKANCTKLAIYLQATFMCLENFVSSRILIMKIKSNYWICGRRVASKYQFTIFNASSPTPLQRSDGWRQHCRNPSSSHPSLWRRQIPTRQQILGFLIVGLSINLVNSHLPAVFRRSRGPSCAVRRPSPAARRRQAS